MTTPDEAQALLPVTPFVREERFIVIKRKHLTEDQELGLRRFINHQRIQTSECVVVEKDWPEYETVWRMIEARMTGQSHSLPGDVGTAAINQNDAMRQELAHVGNKVSELARAMGVDQANDDGSWPDLAGRIEKLTLAALTPSALSTTQTDPIARIASDLAAGRTESQRND